MPSRKPFRPNKNRPPFRGDTRDDGQAERRSGKPGEHPRLRGKDRARAEGRPAAGYSQADSREPHGEAFQSEHSDEHRGRRPHRGKSSHSGGSYWIYGNHAVLAAIDNPNRRIRRLVQSGPSGEKLAQGGGDRPLPSWETVDRQALDQLAGRDAVHQGVAALVEPLPDFEIEDVIAAATDRSNAVLVVLDQVTDPHNVGAILRSAAAFGALAVLLTERHAAPETGVLAKAASGALDVTPLVRVANLARAMEQLKEAGFWCVGLAGEAERTLAQANLTGKIALCLGAEGPGLRRLTREHCDLLAKLPTSGPIGHLNVSNAAAVALYELARG